MNSDEVKFLTRPEDKDKQISFEIGYIIPFWSSKPRFKYLLDVWREGVIVDTIDISKKEYYLIGRNKNICDIYLNNMTVSRVHSVLQHKDDGEIFLYDLDSVYGTFINKRPIAKKHYAKLEVGDTFKIGQSNRMFILNGPDELLPKDNSENKINVLEEANSIDGEMKAPSTSSPSMHLVDKKELMEKRIRMISELHNQRESYKRSLLGVDREGVDWGQKDFDDEIFEHQRDEEDFYTQRERDTNTNEDNMNANLNLEEIKERKDLTDKQKKMIEKLENLASSIKKVKDEIIKIKKKESDQGEITEGQQKRVDFNEKRLTDLYSKYEVQENNLRISLSSKDEMGLGYIEQKFDKKLAKELDSDDEFFDRTRNINLNKEINNSGGVNKNISINQPAVTENYETLKQKLENLIRNRQKLTDKLQKIDSGIDSNNKSGIQEVDTLDAFFEQTKTYLDSSQKINITNQINEMTKEISKTQKLISLVTPSHLKIRFKSAEEENAASKNIQRDNTQPQLLNDSKQRKKKAESIFETVNKLNKFSKKVEENFIKRSGEPEEEINEEIEIFKKSIEKEVHMDDDFKRKVEEFKKSLIQRKTTDRSIEDENKGGLIVSSKEGGRDKRENVSESTPFEEIISNIDKPVFDMNNYNQIGTIFTKRKNEIQTKASGKKTEFEIDFSTGGLQTFNNYLDNLVPESSNMISKKRERPVYGVASKPEDRNVNYEITNDEEDYDAIYTIGERGNVEHNLNSNLYDKGGDDE